MYWRKRWIEVREVVSVCWYWLVSESHEWVTPSSIGVFSFQYFPETMFFVSAYSNTSSFLCSLSLLIAFTITSQFHLQTQTPLDLSVCACICVCMWKHMLVLSCRPGRTPNGKRFYHYVWLAISLHISSTIANRASRSITLLPVRPSMQRHTYAIETQTQSQSHTLVSCQPGQMSQP